MTDSLSAIRAELSELRDSLSAFRARMEQIEPEIQALHDEREELVSGIEYAADRATALERAEAVLVEHSASTPAPADPEPAQAPEPLSPARERLRRELRESTSHTQEPAPRPAPRGRRGRYSRQPLGVIERPGSSHPAPKPRGAERLDEGGQPYAAELPSLLANPTWIERSALVVDILVDRDGAASGAEITEDLTALMECKRATAQTIVSRCIAILAHQGRVAYTGQKGENSAGRLSSPIWKLVEEDS